MKNLLLSLSIVLAIVACGNSNKLAGTYVGTIPSAAGEGIQYKLSLDANNTYSLVCTYVGEKDGITTNTGKWSLDDNKVILSNVKEGNKFLVKDDALVLLDLSGNVITGSTASLYILKKCNKDSKCSATKSSCAPDNKSCQEAKDSCKTSCEKSCEKCTKCGKSDCKGADKASCSADSSKCCQKKCDKK